MSAFTDSVSTCFSKYVTFSGRAKRPEYWWFVLFAVLGSIIFSILDSIFFGREVGTEVSNQPLSTFFSLGIFLPMLAAGWRRLHDTGRPGWYLLLPIAVSLVMTLGMVLGMLAFSATDPTTSNPEELGASVAVIGLGGVAVAVLVQLALAILMIWWLSRPTQEQENKYGPVPD